MRPKFKASSHRLPFRILLPFLCPGQTIVQANRCSLGRLWNRRTGYKAYCELPKTDLPITQNGLPYSIDRFSWLFNPSKRLQISVDSCDNPACTPELCAVEQLQFLASLSQLINNRIEAWEACSFDRKNMMIQKILLICALAVALTVLLASTASGQLFRRSNAGYAPLPVQGRLNATPFNSNSGYAQPNTRPMLRQQPSCSCQGNQAQVAESNFAKRPLAPPTQRRSGYAVAYDRQTNRYVLRPVAGQGNDGDLRSKQRLNKQVDLAKLVQRRDVLAQKRRLQPTSANSILINVESRVPVLTAPATVITTTIEPQASSPQLSAPKSTAEFTPIEAGVTGTLTSDTGEVIDQNTQRPITKTIAIDRSGNEPTPAPVPEEKREKKTFSILDSSGK